MVIILDGRETSNKIMSELEEQVKQLKEKNITPGLALVLTGTDKYSARYVKMKKRRAEKMGIKVWLVQLPLVEGLEELPTVEAINPEKDVDGLTSTTLGRVLMGEDAYLPAGVEAIMELLNQYNIDPSGKHWLIAGGSNFLGKPLAAYLINMDVQVTFCNKDYPIFELTKTADVISTELYKKQAITADMVKDGVIVIDNGNNYEGSKVFGDVDTENVSKKASAITPVPGGTGPMLISMLLRNTIKAATP
jgi:methylenetetrahydrofolate dehydrogenase (NADP+)/methenyltetrahydrofolate cyclohydrolase